MASKVNKWQKDQWTEMPTNVCSACFEILHRTKGFNYQESSESAADEYYLDQSSFHALETTAVKDAAAAGCVLCKEFLSLLKLDEHGEGEGNVGPFAPSDVGLGLGIAPHTSPFSDSTKFELEIACEFADKSSGDLVGVTLGIQHGQSFVSRRRYDVLASDENDNPALQCLSGNHANPFVDSPRAFSKARKWIDECTSTHTRCFEQPSALPQRLINVQFKHHDFDLRIEHGFKELQRPEYATLSYCWGAAQPHSTNLANIDGRLLGLKSSMLPQTIRDAIRVTRQLGIRYLWIDSLCILQDSKEDKLSEITKMGAIYSGSLVTISAAVASAVSEGFLEPRSISEQRKVSLLPYWCAEGAIGSVDLVDSSLSAFTEEKVHEPIDSRAWTLQESLLSPRVLHFGLKQLQFRCFTALRFDGGLPNILSSNKPSTLPKTPYNVHSPVSITTPAVQSQAKAYFLETWSEILADYTDRKMTVPGDRLLAIMGIGSHIRQKWGYEYRYGLWSEHLVECLCWSRRPFLQVHPAKVSRQAAPNCPSWSWGSVNFACRLEAPTSSRSADAVVCTVSSEASERDTTLMLSAPLLRIRRPRIGRPTNLHFSLQEEALASAEHGGWLDLSPELLGVRVRGEEMLQSLAHLDTRDDWCQAREELWLFWLFRKADARVRNLEVQGLVLSPYGGTADKGDRDEGKAEEPAVPIFRRVGYFGGWQSRTMYEELCTRQILLR